MKQIATIFSQIVQWVRQESAATQALIQAFVALGIAFQWWHWTNAQTGAVVGISAVLLGMFVRSQVTPLIRPRDGGRALVPSDEPVIRPVHQQSGELQSRSPEDPLAPAR